MSFIILFCRNWLRGTVQLPALSTIQPTIIKNSTVHFIHHPLLLELTERNRATTRTLNNTANYNYKQYSTCHSSSSSLGTGWEEPTTPHTLNNTTNYNYKQYSTCHSSSSSLLEPWLRGTMQLPALSTIQPIIIINSTVHVIHHPLL